MEPALRSRWAGRWRPRSLSGLLGLISVAWVAAALPSAAQAQTVVVANFMGKPRKAAVNVRTSVVKALSDQGVKLVAYKQYLRKGRKLRIRPARALQGRSIRRLAKAMKLDGVVTGSVKRKGRTFIVTVHLIGANGRVLAKKAYRLKRPALPAGPAGKLAGLMVEKLGGTAVAEAPVEAPVEPTPPPVEPETATTETTTEGSSGSSDAFLPPWARTDSKTETGAATSTTDEGTTSTPATSEVTETAPPPRSRKKKHGAVPDILVTAAGSMNMRMGLNPRHESGMFPGIRADLRMFLGSFLDTIVVKDIGIGGMFNMGLGLQYGPQNSDDKWTSAQMQWQGEIMYRLAFNDVPLKPAILVRFGFGSTTATIDTDNALAVSAGYMYPYGALDIYLMLLNPYLRFYASGGYLFTVMTSEELDGSGSGFTVRGGIDVDLFDNLHIGVGYDLWQFIGFSVGADESSDTYHNMFLRVGWNFQ